MCLRTETAAGHEAIRRVIGAAFAGAAHAPGTGAGIDDALREAGALSLSRVADIDGRIARSPVAAEDGARGGRGQGRARMRAALAGLPRLHAANRVVPGDPPCSARFGAHTQALLHYPGTPTGCSMALALGDAVPRGTVAYPSAFSAA